MNGLTEADDGNLLGSKVTATFVRSVARGLFTLQRTPISYPLKLAVLRASTGPTPYIFGVKELVSHVQYLTSRVVLGDVL